ncbi:MAG: hypothetical protein RL244_1872 [Pseudomonadota bacterium]|jgi:DNA-binding Lrp family transcriptional regulator
MSHATASSHMPLLDAWQRDLPLEPRPFARMAAAHGLDEAALLALLQQALDQKLLSRVGGIFAPNTVGASTLAAVSVPPDQIEAAAALINRYPEVNHNYLREHPYNLWFVVAATDRAGVQGVLDEIGTALGQTVLDLPLEAEYHVDLGFSLQDGSKVAHRPAPAALTHITPGQRMLMAALGHGLALAPQPYAAVARSIGWSEQQVIDQLADWVDRGVLRRLGLIVRHHEFGYTANAMCVWQVPPALRDAKGEALAAQHGVNLCYGRPARGSHWPYNLFCMVHGKDRTEVSLRVTELNQAAGLEHMPHAVLFSTRRFKQSGALYGRMRPHAAN